MVNPNCPKCQGKGQIREKDGSIHTCWDCLQDGSYDQHSKEIRDTDIRL
jgi:DnaJ-class molecular chaperone